MTADTTVTVLPLAADYTPGTTADAFYDNIAGHPVSSLTGSANFPYNASSELYLTSADYETPRPSHRTTIRRPAQGRSAIT